MSARIARDLRYWTARRGNAPIAPKPIDTERVQFGLKVTIDRDDGRRETFRIVGEDEANPNAGTLSYLSPLARAFIGRREGDQVRLNDVAIDIAEVE